MNLTISGNGFEVTPALREHVKKKLAWVTQRFHQPPRVAVVLGVEEKLAEKGRRQTALITLHAKGEPIVADQAHKDLYIAINLLMNKLGRQVDRHKGKRQGHSYRSPKRSSQTVQ